MKHDGNKRKLTGIVVSNKMEKTVVVNVERIVKHKLYQKYIKTKSRYPVHDEKKECQIGDKVQIIECRPLSKTKRWRLLNIIEKAA